MKMKIYRNTKIAFTGIVALASITGAAIFGGFQGVMAAMGLFVVAAIAVFGVSAMKKARLYARAISYADEVENFKFRPVDEKDSKWIIKHIEELFGAGKEKKTSAPIPITTRDRKEIMAEIDAFFTDSRNTGITGMEKKEIMVNIRLLFEGDEEQDRELFA